ncbi:MAG: UMP kinase [Candidatus Paceibacterota bacterium]
MNKKNQIVMSLGGSLIIPNEIDVEFLKSFVVTIKDYVSRGFSFLIITGGGKLCRKYNDSLKKIVEPSLDDLDWMGISVTRLNAEFVRICFGDLAYEKVVLDPDAIPETNKPIIIGCGWKPGNSSDLAAVHSAHSIGATKIINLSNIDFVCDKDPKKYPGAKPLYKMSWSDFRNLFGNDWNPGANVPFDQTAAREAESFGYEVIILNGKNLENLKSYLDNKSFVGTIIK